MRPSILYPLAFILLSGCATQAISQETPPSPTVLTGETLSTGSSSQRLTLRLTLSHPSDLKVKEGDRITANDVISDRTRDRERLEAQKQTLQLELERLNQPIPAAAPVRPVPEIAGLPPATFLDEVAEVERKRLLVREHPTFAKT